MRVPALALSVLLTAALGAALAQNPAPPATPAPTPSPPSPILATVNGSQVTQAHVDKALRDRWATPLMRAIVEERLVLLEARRLGVKVTEDEVGKGLAAEYTFYSDKAALTRHLQKIGMTEQAFRANFTVELLLRKLMAAQAAQVTEIEARDYYEAHKGEYGSPGKVHLLAIVTRTIEDAYLARERVAAGDKFDVVARELSVHESKDNGGDMGWLAKDDLTDEKLRDTVFALETGVVSDPLRVGDEYYILLVRERKGGEVVSFAEAKADILDKLRARKTISRDAYLRMLARKATIRVDWEPCRYLTEEYARLKQTQVVVDGQALDLDTPPVRLPNGNLMVPAKPILQAMGARLVWQAGEQSLTATNSAGTVKVFVGSATAVVGDKEKQAQDMKQAPEVRDGLLFIAPRVVVTALGGTVAWDGPNNTLEITSPVKAMPAPTTGGHGGLSKQP